MGQCNDDATPNAEVLRECSSGNVRCPGKPVDYLQSCWKQSSPEKSKKLLLLLFLLVMLPLLPVSVDGKAVAIAKPGGIRELT